MTNYPMLPKALHVVIWPRPRAHPRNLTVALRRSLLVGTAFVIGCARTVPLSGVPTTPATRAEPWTAPAGVVAPEPARASLAAARDIARPEGQLALAQVVELALRNNPQTQLSWAQARAGAATAGAAAASYVPTVDATSNIVRSQTTSQLGAIERSTLTPQVNLTYLLLDFGGRSGTVAAARAAAIALDLTHNATLQNVALGAEQAFFNYQAQQSLLTATQLTVAVADTNLASARQRNQSGVATIADVLQAETLLAQAQLDLETAQGNLQIARGNLSIAMGLPANATFDVVPATDSVSVSAAGASVDSLIDRALASRPDLAALRTQIQQTEAQVRVARSAQYPAITLGANVGKTISNVNAFQGLNYGLNLGITVPIFNLARPYNLAAAEAQVEAATARAGLLRVQIGQQVFASYFTLQTAAQRTRTTNTLLASATKSEEVARARYRAGVGTIVDLITAQTALASARAQQAQSRWVWASALAQLSHDVGVLGTNGQSTIPLVPR
ncbi:MAG: TolC family protein [Gemmatimonadota bacterium]